MQIGANGWEPVLFTLANLYEGICVRHSLPQQSSGVLEKENFTSTTKITVKTTIIKMIAK
jgi:hypothetical protein